MLPSLSWLPYPKGTHERGKHQHRIRAECELGITNDLALIVDGTSRHVMPIAQDSEVRHHSPVPKERARDGERRIVRVSDGNVGLADDLMPVVNETGALTKG